MLTAAPLWRAPACVQQADWCDWEEGLFSPLEGWYGWAAGAFYPLADPCASVGVCPVDVSRFPDRRALFLRPVAACAPPQCAHEQGYGWSHHAADRNCLYGPAPFGLLGAAPVTPSLRP